MRKLKTIAMATILIATSSSAFAVVNETTSLTRSSTTTLSFSLKKKARSGNEINESIVDPQSQNDTASAHTLLTEFNDTKRTLLFKKLPDHLVAANP